MTNREMEAMFAAETPLTEKGAALLPYIERCHDELTVAKAKAEALGDDDLKVRFQLAALEMEELRTQFREGIR